MIKNKFIKEIIYTICYLLISIIYSIKLNIINKELVELSLIKVLTYNKYIAIYYFIGFVLLIIIACCLIHKIFSMKSYIETTYDVITLFALILLIVAMSLILITLIQNPILKAMALALLIGSALKSGS